MLKQTPLKSETRNPRMNTFIFIRSALQLNISAALLTLPLLAQAGFLDLPFEDLLKVEISSASRKLQQVQEVAAAVFVISREDITRSGARSIPEALRLAPGVEVARIANNRWAVSIRGFNGRFANKLLVLKDGRSVYSPLFSGVMWEAEDANLGDIERIEVIRGPSAAIWGANAVNGVINIISRKSADTLGTEVSASTATDEPGSVTVRHGLAVGDGHLRLSAKGFDLAASKAGDGSKGNDSWRAGRFGLRADWPAADGGSWTLLGAAYHSRADDRMNLADYSVASPVFDVRQTNAGSNLSLRRELPLSDGGQIEWQIGAETSVVDVETLLREKRETISGEFQQRTPLGGQHELLWGGSYRVSRDQITLRPSAIFDPSSFDRQQRDWRIASVFVHDEMVLIPEKLRLSGGVRIDSDNWSSAQAQPDLRLAWTPSTETTWWTSLARAARLPSRLELDVPVTAAQTAAMPPYMPAIKSVRFPPPQGTLKPELVNSLEAGWRQRLSAQLSVDVAAFVSDYADLVSFAVQQPQPVSPTLIIVPITSNNAAKARTQGLEVVADWQPSANWRIQANYSQLRLSSPRLMDVVGGIAQDMLEGRVPRHRASLRSSWTLADGSHLDLWLKSTSRLKNPQVAAYTTLDLRYAFKLGEQVELAVVGQNLLDPRHPEFVSDYLPVRSTEIGRSLLVKATWHY
jgi:iron complex outermembrane receptor protein